MEVIEQNQSFPHKLKCTICGGEVKRVTITIYDTNDVRRLTSHRCQKCLRMFSKLDDIDIIMGKSKK
jgi:hypothetical protein